MKHTPFAFHYTTKRRKSQLFVRIRTEGYTKYSQGQRIECEKI